MTSATTRLALGFALGAALALGTAVAQEQRAQPSLYRIGVYDIEGRRTSVHWFETSDAECYVSHHFQGSGISCLRKGQP